MSCGQAHLCVINKLVRDRARGSIAQLLLRWKQKTSSWPQTLNTKQGYGSFNLFLHTPRPLSCRTASTMSMYILPLWIWISRPHVSRNHVYINTHVLYTCVYIYTYNWQGQFHTKIGFYNLGQIHYKSRQIVRTNAWTDLLVRP